jgi:hypothetical protein
MARAYDSWDFLDKQDYNPDGTMKPHKRQRLIARGMSLSSIDYLEQQKIQEVQKFEQREQRWLEQYGKTFTEWEAEGRLSDQELRRRQQSALRNQEDISELPIAIDPDDIESWL